jgi:hypothetical protein
MANGPGKYDDVCTCAREATGARTVVLIVLEGREGSGFSVQSNNPPSVMRTLLPNLLREMAADIERTVNADRD